jgi:hypothetical protein
MNGTRKVTTSSLSVAAQFNHLKPLRTWLFWLPVTYLQRTGASPSALVVIAHYYKVALLMERLFPEIGAAYLGSMIIGPMEEIARPLYEMRDAGHREGDIQTPLSLMELPIETVNEFRSRMGWAQPVRTRSFPHFDHANFHMSEGSPLMLSANPSSEYLSYGENVPFSCGTEDLFISREPGPNGGPVSPPQLSSSNVNPRYLNTPYGGYSPTSRTSGGDFSDTFPLPHSDLEDNGSDGVPHGSTPPVLGGANTCGVGLVPPIQTVWL